MVIGPGDRRRLNLGTLYHEYLHYVVRANSSFKYPRWFDEGIAELFSSLEYDEDFVVVGNMADRAAGRYAKSKLLDLESLLTKTNILSAPKNSITKYYSTAWLFVHFLHFSSVNGFDDYRPSLIQFLDLYNKGVAPLAAFEQAFPVSLKELQKQLERYNRKRTLFAQRFGKPKVQLSYESQELDPGQLYANMSHLAFSSGQRDYSDQFLEHALKLNNSKALSVKSFLLVRQGKTAEAIALLDGLVVIKDLDAEVYLNIGQAYKELIKHMPERKEEMRRLAIYYLEKAKKLGRFSQTHVFLADLYWQAGEQQKAAEEIIGAVKLMPSNIYLNHRAGFYMVKMKNKPFANFFLGNVLNWSKNPMQIAQAQVWLNEL
jgi:tetratricopeptide (TPR) repeat protein